MCFLGYPTHQKGYKIYNLLTHSSFVSRDVVFHEHIFPFAESSSKQFFQPLPVSMPNHPSVYDPIEPFIDQNAPVVKEENVPDDNVVPNTHNVPVPNTHNISDPVTSTSSNTTSDVRRSTRSSKPPSWTKDFVVPTLKPAANQVISPVLSPEFCCFLTQLVVQQDPKGFKEAIKVPGWRNAMDAELRALEENETWEVTTLPDGKIAIGSHWIYKTKLKADGSVDR